MRICRLFFMTAIAALAPCILSAQSVEAFEPRETWPYIYENFQPGRLVNVNKTVFDVAEANVSVAGCEIHFIKNGVVLKADSSIMMAQIDGETYMKVNGRFMRIFKETEHGAVVRSLALDTEAMERTSIGYGSSAVATTKNVSATALEGSVEGAMSSNVINKSLASLISGKASGRVLPLKEDLYLVVGGAAFKATRYDLSMVADLDKAALKKYIKDNKVKFSKKEDLAGLAEFIYQQITHE